VTISRIEVALHRVPDREVAHQQQREHRRAGVEADVQYIGQDVGDLGAEDAHQHHAQPVDPGLVLTLAQLQGQRGGQQQGHHHTGDAQPPADIDGEKVGEGFANGGGHDLDDPEGQRHFRDFVEPT
jgi:hypothetical protein